MNDAIRGTLELMDKESLPAFKAYNLEGMAFTPAELTRQIRKHYPKFKVIYHPDQRQQIADSWPACIDDSEAVVDWGWKSMFKLSEMVADMISNLKLKETGMMP